MTKRDIKKNEFSIRLHKEGFVKNFQFTHTWTIKLRTCFLSWIWKMTEPMRVKDTCSTAWSAAQSCFLGSSPSELLHPKSTHPLLYTADLKRVCGWGIISQDRTGGKIFCEYNQLLIFCNFRIGAPAGFLQTVFFFFWRTKWQWWKEHT